MNSRAIGYRRKPDRLFSRLLLGFTPVSGSKLLEIWPPNGCIGWWPPPPRPSRLQPLPWALPVPLRVHGRYSRAEVMAAFSVLDKARDPGGVPRNHREGVLWHEPSQCDLLFVTLNKSEALFSPTARYRDLALGPSLFHWESQSVTTAASPTGQRYIHHEARGSRVLLFVREHRREGGRSGGVTEPFRCLGFARYEGHEGERPMAIRWRLEVPIPAAWQIGRAHV